MNLEKKLALALEKTKESLSLYKKPIAIIGMSCRFTQAKNINEFWRLWEQGKDGINEIPPDCWDVSEYYDSNPDALGKMMCKKGGFIEGISQFDANFFNVSPKEANYLDPQQRLLLKQTWHALEHASISPYPKKILLSPCTMHRALS